MNRENLQTLATFLAYGPEPVLFDMGAIFEQKIECGTVCCAAGYGPIAGIKMLKNERDEEAWLRYIERVFFHPSHKAFDWCFSGQWDRADNTRLGAAQRIQYLLDSGQPIHWDMSAATVALYQSTEVKREHPQNEVVCPVAERPHRLIVELLNKIEREPKAIFEVVK